MAEIQDGSRRRSELRGVLGVVGGDLRPALGDSVLEQLLRLGLGGLEIRADLFGDLGDALRCLEQVKARSPVLFTVRNSNEGGNFRGDEATRVELLKAAVQAGASLVDAEWGTGAARELSRSGAPLLISHHDFKGTPSATELARITAEMEAIPCRAIKLVPTARSLDEALRILAWIEGRIPGGPMRVGFSMGEAGFASRILAISRGSPFTYGSIGAPVAPGQISAEEMLRVYRPERRTPATRVVGVVKTAGAASCSPLILNPAFEARGIDALCLPLAVERFEEAIEALDPLCLDALRVEEPFKEEALRRAGSADSRSEASGGADFLMVERGKKDGRRTLRAMDTGIAGFLAVLGRRFKDLSGLDAAVIGGGAGARTALRALVEAGASPTIFYRNIEKDGISPGLAGVARRPIRDLKRGMARLIVNVDPEPPTSGIFDSSTCAIEMGGLPGETPFLAAAREAGAACIAGEDLVVGQAVEEIKAFTGQAADFDQLHESLARGQGAGRPGD